MLNHCYPLLSIIHQLTGMILLCPAVDKPFLTISPLSNPTGFVNVTNWQSQLEISINMNKPQTSTKWTLTLVVDFDSKPWHVAFFVPKIHDFFKQNRPPRECANCSISCANITVHGTCNSPMSPVCSTQIRVSGFCTIANHLFKQKTKNTLTWWLHHHGSEFFWNFPWLLITRSPFLGWTPPTIAKLIF